MTPAVKIYIDGHGEWQSRPAELYYSSPARLDVALDKVARGRTVFVQPEDAAAVLAAAKGEGVGSGADR